MLIKKRVEISKKKIKRRSPWEETEHKGISQIKKLPRKSITEILMAAALCQRKVNLLACGMYRPQSTELQSSVRSSVVSSSVVYKT